MNLSALSKLYLAAGALFLLAAAIGFSDGGFELKSVLGLIMAGVMVTLGLKSRGGKVA